MRITMKKLQSNLQSNYLKISGNLRIFAKREIEGDGYEKTAESLENTGFSAVSSLARRKGFEPLTFWSVARHSIQLS